MKKLFKSFDTTYYYDQQNIYDSQQIPIIQRQNQQQQKLYVVFLFDSVYCLNGTQLITFTKDGHKISDLEIDGILFRNQSTLYLITNPNVVFKLNNSQLELYTQISEIDKVISGLFIHNRIYVFTGDKLLQFTTNLRCIGEQSASSVQFHDSTYIIGENSFDYANREQDDQYSDVDELLQSSKIQATGIIFNDTLVLALSGLLLYGSNVIKCDFVNENAGFVVQNDALYLFGNKNLYLLPDLVQMPFSCAHIFNDKLYLSAGTCLYQFDSSIPIYSLNLDFKSSLFLDLGEEIINMSSDALLIVQTTNGYKILNEQLEIIKSVQIVQKQIRTSQQQSIDTQFMSINEYIEFCVDNPPLHELNVKYSLYKGKFIEGGTIVDWDMNGNVLEKFTEYQDRAEFCQIVADYMY
ncbi:Hypothetical_protein [Hexamita inflata]|uniref:Hypothetical_protein n=1 Tax=Hexamita inflata TaxID=28002 RepID=A0ABP1IK05_9EUKA